MDRGKTEADETGSLEILGINDQEEELYSYLLSCGGATKKEIEKALSLAPGKTQALIDRVEAKGLISHSPKSPIVYLPNAPDIALGSMLYRHQENIQRAQLTISALQERAKKLKVNEQIVELLVEPKSQKKLVDRIYQMAQEEVLALMTPPLLINRVDVPMEVEHKFQWDAMRRGVVLKSIVDWPFLDLPHAVESVQSDIKSGEDVRLISRLPFKMLLVDRSLAIVPLRLREEGGEALIIRESALLDALCALFDILWRKATPIAINNNKLQQEDRSEAGDIEEAEKLIALLAAGINDKTVANELDVSMRTLYRRITDLMNDVDARTRFQLGWVLGVNYGRNDGRLDL